MVDNDITEFEGVKIESSAVTKPVVFHGTILKEIRSWATTLLVLGVISLFASNFLSAPWGLLLIVVGLASFYFRSSAMMVIYAVTLAWAGISNALSGGVLWIGFAILQLFLVVRVFQKFISFRQAETNTIEDIDSSGLTPKRSATIFPWAAIVLGSVSLLGFVGLLVGVVVASIMSGKGITSVYLSFLESLVVEMGILGFALGLASVLSRYSKKALAIIGMITGILPPLLEIIFRFVLS
jgi:hypothetical protein